MKRKCATINAEPSFHKVFEHETDILWNSSGTSVDESVLISMPHYVAVGCDLTDTRKLNAILRDRLRMTDVPMLFVAEVSMTYMGVKAADEVLRWASSFTKGNAARVLVWRRNTDCN